MNIFKSLSIAVTFCLLPLFTNLAQAGLTSKKVALVLGNGNYEHVVPLVNPFNDAKAIAETLRSLGFSVVDGYDLGRNDVDAVLRDFARQSSEADVKLFFYAGHGMSVAGKNYIIPVDAEFNDAISLDFEAVEVDFIIKQMNYSDGVSLVFLDACRDNPLAAKLSRSLGAGTRSAAVNSGLAKIDVPTEGKGLAIAFATSPGDVAYDGETDHSPFTQALLNHIATPNMDITEVMSRVTGDVLDLTERQQRPWINASLTGSVYLNQQETIADTPSVATTAITDPKELAATLELQKVIYEIALQTDNVDDYRSYLKQYPNGIFAENARRSIARLDQVEVASVDKDQASELRVVAKVDMEAIKNSVANQNTESIMAMTRVDRAEVQTRLNLTGFDVGTADGSFGPNTRRGIIGWQEKNDLSASGYLNEKHLELLREQTKMEYASFIEQQGSQVLTRNISGSSSGSSGKSSKNTTQNGNKAEVFGRFVGGVAESLFNRR